MSLTLKVKYYKNTPPPQLLSAVFDQRGGSIGRARDNDWVLDDPDKYLSGHHATITYSNGNYSITDTSSNGVFILPSSTPLGRNNSVVLQNGDQLGMGEYLIEVHIEADQPKVSTPGFDELSGSSPQPTLIDDPFGDLGADPLNAMIKDDKAEQFSASKITPGLPDDFFTDAKPIEQNDNFFASEPDHTPALHESFDPSKGHFEPFDSASSPPSDSRPGDIDTDTNSGAAFLPENWFNDNNDPDNPTEDENACSGFPADPAVSVPEEPATPLESSLPPIEQLVKPQPSMPPAEVAVTPVSGQPPIIPATRQPASSDASAISSFCAGAGIDEALAHELNADSFYRIGQMFRTALQGAMEVLLARAQIKNEMRMDVTTIRAAENNPMKFSVTIDDAFSKLLAPQAEKGYMEPVEAVREAFDDIKIHQIAVIAGMQSALQIILKRFDPEVLERRLQKQSPISAAIPVHRQATLWRLFESLYEEIETEAQDDFNQLFGHAFAKAYEQQIERLKSQRQNEFNS